MEAAKFNGQNIATGTFAGIKYTVIKVRTNPIDSPNIITIRD